MLYTLWVPDLGIKCCVNSVKEALRITRAMEPGLFAELEGPTGIYIGSTGRGKRFERVTTKPQSRDVVERIKRNAL